MAFLDLGNADSEREKSDGQKPKRQKLSKKQRKKQRLAKAAALVKKLADKSPSETQPTKKSLPPLNEVFGTVAQR